MKGWRAIALAAAFMVASCHAIAADDTFEALKRVREPTVFALGDSLLAGANTGAAINGGIGGYRISDVLADVDRLKYTGLWRRVSCLVVSVGVNDAHVKDGPAKQARLDAFRLTLKALIAATNGTPLILMTVAEPTSGTVGARIDWPLVKDINSIIRQSSSPVYDMAASLRRTLGERYDEAFVDGVHLNPKGYLVWNSNFAEAIEECGPASALGAH